MNKLQTYDKLWKGILEDLFPYVLQMFFSDLVEKVDFEKDFEFLDQELALLMPDSENKNRTVDKLVKVFLKNGTEQWIFIHIEVQGYSDLLFPKRMFTSFYRIIDKYDKEVIALALFTDKKKDFKPNVYEKEFHGTKIRYEYLTYKVIEQDEKILKASDNPFALVILATQIAIKKKKSTDEELLNIKWELARLLYEREYDKKIVSSVFRFINYYIRFENRENYINFAKDINSTFQNKKYNMGVLEILYEDARIEGKAEGKAEGRVEGEAIGEAKGFTLKTKQVVITMLTKFPEWENEMIADLAQTTIGFVAEIRAKLS